MTLPLPCGHQPLPNEHLRAGADHWCPTEQRWYGPGQPVALAGHLASAHAVVSRPPTDEEAIALHRTLHADLGPADHDHPCPRCGTDHSEWPDEALGAVLACTRAQATRAGSVGLVDQIDALRRDVGLRRDRALSGLPQYLAEDGDCVRCYGCGAWVDKPAEVCDRCRAGGL